MRRGGLNCVADRSRRRASAALVTSEEITHQGCTRPLSWERGIHTVAACVWDLVAGQLEGGDGARSAHSAQSGKVIKQRPGSVKAGTPGDAQLHKSHKDDTLITLPRQSARATHAGSQSSPSSSFTRPPTQSPWTRTHKALYLNCH